jgi:hypothetical protein
LFDRGRERPACDTLARSPFQDRLVEEAMMFS